MEKIYYIGHLSTNDSNDTKIFKNIFSTEQIDLSLLNTDKLKLSRYDYMCFRNFLNEFENYYSIITDEKFIEIVKKANLPAYRQRDNTPNFIFEIVKDVDGYSYAREILTQRLFPLLDREQTKEDIRYNYNNDNKIDEIFTYENPKIAKINYAFYYFQTATKNEVNEYIVKNTKKFRIDKHIKLVNKYYNENVFSEKIILKENKILEQQDEITKLMEDIEFELSILKHYYKDLYEKFLKKYKNMCNEKNLVKPQKNDFIKLLSKIKFDLSLKEDNIKDVNQYLNLTIEDYFNKLINNIELKKELNIDDIDNLVEFILKNKEDFNINNQRKYLTKISLLYLLVIKNSNNINEYDLDNGYFKDNIKTVVYNIITLKDLGIIMNDFLPHELKDVSITKIVNLIKEIDFDKCNKDKIKLLTREN